MKTPPAFLLLVVLSPLLLAQQRMMPPYQDPFPKGFSGVLERSGDRRGVPLLPMRSGNSVEEPGFAPGQWRMRSQLFDGGKSALPQKTHTADSFYLPDTVIAYYKGYDTETDDTTRHTYTYDAGGNMLAEFVEGWVGTQWENRRRSSYIYEAGGNILTVTALQEEWNGSLWVNHTRFTKTYDASGNMLTALSREWNGSQWVNYFRNTYTYGASGNVLTHLWEDWNGSQWVAISRSSYTYDAGGNMLAEFVWDGSQWRNRWRCTYTYDVSGNMLTWLSEEWTDLQWVNCERSTYIYESGGEILTVYHFDWSITASQWVNSSRSTYAYDAMGNILLQLFGSWNGNMWVDYRRCTYTYDTRGNITLFRSFELSGISWLPSNWHLSILAGKYDYFFSGYQITLDHKEITTSVASQKNGRAKSYELAQNYPNPFNPTTVVRYQLPVVSKVKLSVFDMLGCEVSVLVNERMDAGAHEVTFDASGLSSGVYLYRLQAGDFVQTRKLLLLR